MDNVYLNSPRASGALELTCAAQIPTILLSKPKSIWESEREENSAKHFDK
jgi:hypothetical protein